MHWHVLQNALTTITWCYLKQGSQTKRLDVGPWGVQTWHWQVSLWNSASCMSAKVGCWHRVCVCVKDMPWTILQYCVCVCVHMCVCHVYVRAHTHTHTPTHNIANKLKKYKHHLQSLATHSEDPVVRIMLASFASFVQAGKTLLLFLWNRPNTWECVSSMPSTFWSRVRIMWFGVCPWGRHSWLSAHEYIHTYTGTHRALALIHMMLIWISKLWWSYETYHMLVIWNAYVHHF